MIIFAKIRISINYKDFITQNVQPACISNPSPSPINKKPSQGIVTGI